MAKVVIEGKDRAAVEELCTALGVSKAAMKLGMSQDSLLRILAKQPVHEGTVLRLKQALAALAV